MKSENRISVRLPERFGDRGRRGSALHPMALHRRHSFKSSPEVSPLPVSRAIPKVSSKWYGANYRTKALEYARANEVFLRKRRSVNEKKSRPPAESDVNGFKTAVIGEGND